ncbi:transcription termination factor NusA [Lactococcus garvieae]|uniref:Transcription termination/antitermination protein NusA n=1 Tax=Lactococcus garvieae (strain Lg2) TaxID=420890 RepID=F9VCU2_LACGL|nr:transcription termination factor NusA [Lactococcus garvieae]EOT32474.1 transcription termination factor NusA [Lactococcus garvieae ATCC 49156]EOT93784.1 transcription termination factor NusA [Lactococcus garvieae ATCC 49156]BAK58176.1 transcription termination factor NusA [Lactococcus garvieae ATCC 49156]BAK60143.1 transcription termination factor NusA [Lactococcus garvieae Lg2]BDW47085.1 transcription termination/antitermination protein NusA [Lactococcus garvieae]
MSKEMLNAFKMLEEEKGIKQEIVIEAIEQAITAAYKRQYGQAQNVKVIFDEKKGNFNVYSTREIVDEVFDSRLEISLEDAQELNPHYEIGDKIMFEEKPKDFARTAAGAAKQVIMQKMREEERTIIYNEYSRYKDEIIMGTVEKVDARAVYVNLGRVDALLTAKDRISQENYHVGDKVKVYVTDVLLTPKGTRVFISRTAPDMLKRMFEKEIPEVYDGTVEIKSVARDAGDRAKVIVESHDENVDAIGTMVGAKGARIQGIIRELAGEKMDIIEYNADKATLIANALKPARIEQVAIREDGSAIAVVAQDQLSLAIGKRGQNVRLAAHVTNCKIDIKSEEDFQKEMAELDALVEEVDEIVEEVAETVSEEATTEE